MSEHTPALLEVRELGTGYGDLRVVWDAALTVRAGEITALLGRNGAGKTTTLRAIAGLNRVVTGEVLLDGADLGRTPPHIRVRRGIAYVQEGKRVFHEQTIEENLLLGGYARRGGRRRLRGEVERVYDLFPVLAGRRGEAAGRLSGGQQQMLAIGQALMSRPRLLLLDEPSGGLAPAIVAEVMTQVAELKQTGIGILLVEQAVKASYAVADHVAVLDMGRTVLSARATEIDDVSVLENAYFDRGGAGNAASDQQETP